MAWEEIKTQSPTAGEADENKLEVQVQDEPELNEPAPKDGQTPEVAVVDDTPEADRNRKPASEPPADPTPEELEEYSDKVKHRIKHLHKGYHDERRAKETALREKNAAIEYAQAQQQRIRALEEQVNAITQRATTAGTQAAEAKLEAAKREWREAYEAGDADKIVEAQVKIATAQTELMTSKNTQPTLQSYADVLNTVPNAQQAPVQSQQPVAQPTQPVDPKLAQWMQRNTWFTTDPVMTQVAQALHVQYAQRDPQKVNSDEYYADIENRMKAAFPDYPWQDTPNDISNSATVQPQQVQKTVAPRRATPVAPVGNSVRGRTVTLTRSQIALAESLGITKEQYAEQLLALSKG